MFTLFDKAYISVDIGLMKPDKEIYNNVLEDLAISADKALFIDDKLEYVVGAEKVGIRSILFENLHQLKYELRRLDII